jgi:hypothetical protein
LAAGTVVEEQIARTQAANAKPMNLDIGLSRIRARAALQGAIKAPLAMKSRGRIPSPGSASKLNQGIAAGEMGFKRQFPPQKPQSLGVAGREAWQSS